MDSVTFTCQAFYEELRQLRLEASTVADLMDGVRLPLACRPKLIDKIGYAPLELLLRGLSELPKRANDVDDVVTLGTNNFRDLEIE
jgi:hypothetical protein